MTEVFRREPQQPSVTCLECGTKLGEGTTKDVFSHLMVCLHVEKNSLENIAATARGTRSEYGKRVLHIVEALQSSIADGIVASRAADTPRDSQETEGEFV